MREMKPRSGKPGKKANRHLLVDWPGCLSNIVSQALVMVRKTHDAISTHILAAYRPFSRAHVFTKYLCASSVYHFSERNISFPLELHCLSPMLILSISNSNCEQ